MANCKLCGKNINVLTCGVISLPKDDNKLEYIKVCGECEKKFTRAMNSSAEIFSDSRQELLDVLCNSDDSIKERIKLALDIKEKELEKAKVEIILESKRVLEQEKILITTGFNFEGYRIVKYLNIVNGEIVLGTGFLSELSASVNDMLGTASGTIGGKLSKAKQVVQTHLIEKSIGRGANALIGVDFDISILGNNMLIVSATGTAVVIEKIE